MSAIPFQPDFKETSCKWWTTNDPCRSQRWPSWPRPLLANPDAGNVCCGILNPELWYPEYSSREFRIPLAIGIRKRWPSSIESSNEYGIQYMESGIYGAESRTKTVVDSPMRRLRRFYCLIDKLHCRCLFLLMIWEWIKAFVRSWDLVRGHMTLVTLFCSSEPCACWLVVFLETILAV